MTDTVQQLHELPDLAAECFATWGHPNPSERPVVAVKRIHPKAPADLDTLDALRADELGLLHRLAQCVRAVVEDMPLISTALDEGHAMARLLADALKDAIRTLRELAEKAAGEPIPFGDSDLYAEVVDGALDAAAERDALAAKVERVRALHQQAPVRACPDCGGPLPAGHARCTNCKRKAGL